MEKRIWTKPLAAVEQFMANEYVAACWQIACEVGKRNDNDGFGEDGSWGHQSSSGTCGSLNSQYIQDAGKETYKLTEQSRFYGDMACEIVEYIDYNNHTVSGPRGKYTIKIPDGTTSKTIYWITTSGQNTYYHYGNVNITGSTVQNS